jgi:hypothetical protein
MTRRFQIPIDELEGQSRVTDAQQVQTQAESRLTEPFPGPGVHPYGDGATGPDGDGD